MDNRTEPGPKSDRTLIERAKVTSQNIEHLLAETRTVAIDLENDLFASSTPYGSPKPPSSNTGAIENLEGVLDAIAVSVSELSDLLIFLTTLRGRISDTRLDRDVASATSPPRDTVATIAKRGY